MNNIDIVISYYVLRDCRLSTLPFDNLPTIYINMNLHILIARKLHKNAYSACIENICHIQISWSIGYFYILYCFLVTIFMERILPLSFNKLQNMFP